VQKGPGLSFVAVERAAADPGDLLSVDRLHATAHGAQQPSDQRDSEVFGLALLLGSSVEEGDEAVDLAHAVTLVVGAGARTSPGFRTASKIDAAVAFDARLPSMYTLKSSRLRLR
jgi:hypothetical protein